MEIPFGCGPEQIRELCEGKKVSPSDATVRDQFRAVHGTMSPSGKSAQPGSRQPWTTIPLGQKKSKTSKVPQPSGPPLSGRHQDKTLESRGAGGQGSSVSSKEAQEEPAGVEQKDGPPPRDGPPQVATTEPHADTASGSD